ncbi:MAG TPA: hypothetical protein VH969_08190 [Actinophytocola sp.]|jgi:hypothetical protein|uniref:hypothetical protein n=1 Tax=Actinophytocola sp. TaxID=1872138 RepID=UPI002F92A1C4
MPGGRGFLDRLRPVGTPGAAARRGVPADRLAEVGAELEPLFEMLTEIDAEAERIRAEARVHAERTIRTGDERAAAVVAKARERAEAARAGAAASGRARTAAAEAELVRTADDRLAMMRERAAAGIEAVVERAVAAARIELREVSEQTVSTP